MLNNQIKVGSLDPKGSIRDIECGFVPSYVKVFNPNDAGSLFPAIERWSGMAAASGLKTQKVIDNGVTGLASSAYVSSNGLSDFNGEAPSKTLAGTVAITLGASAITGTGTAFLRDLKSGDIVTIGGNKYTINAVTSNTAATIVETAVKTETAALITRETGRSAGFTLGLDTDVNVSGETVFYVAVG